MKMAMLFSPNYSTYTKAFVVETDAVIALLILNLFQNQEGRHY
jgi:hypothetical protein